MYMHPRWSHSGLALLLLPWFFATAHAQAATNDPILLVENAISAIFITLRSQEQRAQQEPQFVLDVIRREILPLVDVDGMARLILATHWRTASPEQQQRFVVAFRETLLQTYGVRLADYLDRQVSVVPRRSRVDERMALVSSEIQMGAGQPNLVVNYRLRPVAGVWKIFDLEAEGLSFVGNFRTQFNTEIHRHGLDALILRLEAGDRSLIETTLEELSAWPVAWPVAALVPGWSAGFPGRVHG